MKAATVVPAASYPTTAPTIQIKTAVTRKIFCVIYSTSVSSRLTRTFFPFPSYNKRKQKERVFALPKIYLSPSTQEFNTYITNGTEESWMNRIADAMEPYLRASGIEFVRNDPSQTVVHSIAESNLARYGMHLALHSNASPESMPGLLRGTDVYYRPGETAAALASRRFAQIAADELKKIYPIPQRVNARPTNYLAEVLQTNSPAVLIEIAYHDNPQDAQWIEDNVEQIAQTIVQALCIYFGIPFAQPQPERTGIVSTGGANLNIRSMPSTDSTIVAVAPNGAKLTIYAKNGDWYTVRFQNATGYAYAPYVSL